MDPICKMKAGLSNLKKSLFNRNLPVDEGIAIYIPKEILEKILSFLPTIQACGVFSRVNKTFNATAAIRLAPVKYSIVAVTADLFISLACYIQEMPFTEYGIPICDDYNRMMNYDLKTKPLDTAHVLKTFNKEEFIQQSLDVQLPQFKKFKCRKTKNNNQYDQTLALLYETTNVLKKRFPENTIPYTYSKEREFAIKYLCSHQAGLINTIFKFENKDSLTI